MIINAETRLNRVLDLDPAIVDYVVSLNPHDFARLHHLLMRRLMSPRITLRRVAQMVGLPVDELVQRIAELGHVAVEPTAHTEPLPQTPAARPARVTADPRALVEVDLLPLDDALDADPLPPVMTAIKTLTPGAVLRFKHRWSHSPSTTCGPPWGGSNGSRSRSPPTNGGSGYGGQSRNAISPALVVEQAERSHFRTSMGAIAGLRLRHDVADSIFNRIRRADQRIRDRLSGCAIASMAWKEEMLTTECR